jgi:hypothetical protein
LTRPVHERKVSRQALKRLSCASRIPSPASARCVHGLGSPTSRRGRLSGPSSRLPPSWRDRILVRAVTKIPVVRVASQRSLLHTRGCPRPDLARRQLEEIHQTLRVGTWTEHGLSWIHLSPFRRLISKRPPGGSIWTLPRSGRSWRAAKRSWAGIPSSVSGRQTRRRARDLWRDGNVSASSLPPPQIPNRESSRAKRASPLSGVHTGQAPRKVMKRERSSQARSRAVRASGRSPRAVRTRAR